MFGRGFLVPTRNVNLTEHFDRFVEAGIASGRFSNASEVVREGLRLPEQREREDRAKIAWLRAAAEDGFDDIERGDYVTLRSGREIDDFIDRLGEEAADQRKGPRRSDGRERPSREIRAQPEADAEADSPRPKADRR
jgi:antitoxin ParD1/3/4